MRSQETKDALAKQDAALGTTWKNNTAGAVVTVTGLLVVILVGAGIIFGLRDIFPIF